MKELIELQFLKLNFSPSRPVPILDKERTFNLNFYFLRAFKALKTFLGTTKKCENKNLD